MQVMTVDYAQALRDPAGTAERLSAFFGAPFNAGAARAKGTTFIDDTCPGSCRVPPPLRSQALPRVRAPTRATAGATAGEPVADTLPPMESKSATNWLQSKP